MKRASWRNFSASSVFPSISALPEHKDDMLACALRWKELLLAAGADEAW